MNRFGRIMLLGATAILAGAMCVTAYAETGDASEAAATLKAKISPVRAIKLAQEDSHGKAFGMGMEVADSKAWYEVQVDVKGKPMVARINPDTGAWLGMKPAEGEDAEGMTTLAHAKVDLTEAVRAAENAGHGRALEAGVSGEGDEAHYAVDIARQGGAIVHFAVDPATGAVHAMDSDEESD